MKAAVRTEYGSPDVVRIAEVDTPSVGEGEVLVEVRVTTVNRTDCGFRAGKPWFIRFLSGLAKPKVTVLGTEFAGVVQAVGVGVKDFRAGDRVFGFSEWRFGAHAGYLSIREDGSITTIPAGVTDEQAAASTEGSHYALSLIRRAKIGRGQDVLVNGATGAIGSAAVQLLKSIGASVTAVCHSEHVELVRGLGADRVIDIGAQDFTRDQQTFDVVLDAVGKSSFGRCKRLLKPHGIYLSSDLGPLSQNPIMALVTPIFGGRRVMFPVPPKYLKAEVEHFKELLESGSFKPLIDRRFALDQIVEAYRYVESGQKVGNVLISVGD